MSLGLDVKTEDVIEPDTTANDGLMDSAWPMYCHDTRHTGRSPYSTADNSGTIKWRYNTNDPVISDPVIDKNGTIYIGAYDLHAVYPNGTLKWKYDSVGTIETGPVIDENGVIYFGTAHAYPDYLYALYPDGTLKWKHEISDSIFSSPVIGEDGSIYFGHGGGPPEGFINAIYPDGMLKWRYTTNHSVRSSPALGLDGTIYCGSHDTYLYALFPNNGTLKWKYKTGDSVTRGVSIANDGTIYFCSWDGYVRALYPNGTLKWKSNVLGRTVPAIGEDGTIYVGGSYLSALYPNDGSIKWQFNPGSDRSIRGSGPSISSDGTIFFGTHIDNGDGGELIAVNSDGTERWRIMLATSWIWSAPAIGEDGTIYIGVWNTKPPSASLGYLYAINALDPNAPSAPNIDGPSTAKEDTTKTFYFTSTSPLDRDVFYYVEWGDGKTTGWNGPHKSGEEITLGHAWGSPGSYTIKARAKDTDNLWGPWGEFEIEITRPRTRTYHWMHFLDMFPVLQRILYFIR